METAAGWRGLATPSSVSPKRRRPRGDARLHFRRGGQTNTGEMRQNINIQVGQIRVSKWAMPEYRTHEYRIHAD
jgi:hypothetical protein